MIVAMGGHGRGRNHEPNFIIVARAQMSSKIGAHCWGGA